jgi:hypothetical protein
MLLQHVCEPLTLNAATARILRAALFHVGTLLEGGCTAGLHDKTTVSGLARACLQQQAVCTYNGACCQASAAGHVHPPGSCAGCSACLASNQCSHIQQRASPTHSGLPCHHFFRPAVIGMMPRAPAPARPAAPAAPAAPAVPAAPAAPAAPAPPLPWPPAPPPAPISFCTSS